MEIESKTKKDRYNIAPGIERITESRQGVVLIRDRYQDLRAGFLKMANSGNVYGEENIRVIAEIATDWLKEQGLPFDVNIYYAQSKEIDPIEINEIITKAVFEEKYENVDPATPGDGGRFGGMFLSNFIEQLGYGRHDYQYLMAKMIILADRALNPKTPKGAVFDAIFAIGRIFQQIEEFSRGDKQTGGSRKRKSLRPYIRAALHELGDSHYMVILSYLKEKGVAEEIGDRVRWAGKSITIKRFENIVYEVKKDIKKGEIHG